VRWRAGAGGVGMAGKSGAGGVGDVGVGDASKKVSVVGGYSDATEFLAHGAWCVLERTAAAEALRVFCLRVRMNS
jgi:hypothetical protein